MSSPYAPSLIRLGSALHNQLPSLSSTTTTTTSSSQQSTTTSTTTTTERERRTCILTLLRILDNILKDPAQNNPKLRKIRVGNRAFWNRAGRWDGAVDYLVECCGFVGVGICSGVVIEGGASSSQHVDGVEEKREEERRKNVPAQLRLEDEEASRLHAARMGLVSFATEVLGMDKCTLPVMDSPVVVADNSSEPFVERTSTIAGRITPSAHAAVAGGDSGGTVNDDNDRDSIERGNAHGTANEALLSTTGGRCFRGVVVQGWHSTHRRAIFRSRRPPCGFQYL